MIDIQTYSLKPYFAANAQIENFTTEWLRHVITKEVSVNSELLISKKVDPSHFHNHDPETGETRKGYPLIIYSAESGMFYITGINNGATALDKFAELYQSLFTMDGVLFKGFRKEKNIVQPDLTVSVEMRTYLLNEWIPLNHGDVNSFLKLDMVAKVNLLNQRLEKHIVGELGRDLGISLNTARVAIINITRVYSDPVIYKGYKYLAYDIEFTTNVELPKRITLGNIKALGYGRVKPTKR